MKTPKEQDDFDDDIRNDDFDDDVDLFTDHTCPICNGTGLDWDDTGRCEYCDGMGYEWWL